MPPSVKDPEAAIARPGVSGVPAAKTPGEPTGKPQPVALEIPVTVNGAHAVAGSDKREPFSETTKTVLIFGHGAVIRLSAMVAPGQLLFLTNEKTKKEVVCQVVKSKNYKTVTGYVELEFTESAAGFWGMRFPAAGSAPRPVAPAAVAPPPAPAAPRVPAPVAAAQQTPPIERATVQIPVVLQVEEPAKPVLAAAPIKEAAPPVIHAEPAAFPPSALASSSPAKAPESSAPVPAGLVPAAGFPAEKVAVAKQENQAQENALPVETQSAPVRSLESALFSTTAAIEREVEKRKAPAEDPAAAQSSSAELKEQAARLQEQLGAMLFAGNSDAKPSQPAPAKKEGPARPNAEQTLLDLFEAKVEPQAPAAIKNSTSATNPLMASLDAEEVKIPSWLAPLARETESATVVPAAQKTETPEIAGKSEFAADNSVDAIVPLADEVAERPQTVVFGGQLMGDAQAGAENRGSGSKKGLLFAFAAALLLAGGGGYWYLQQGAGSVASTASTANAAITQPTEAADTSVRNSAPATDSATVSSKANTISVPPAATNSSSATPVQTGKGNSPFTPPQVTPRNSTLPVGQPAVAEESKKPALGNVRLANPVVGRKKNGNDSDIPAPSIDMNQPAVGGDTLGGLVGGHSNQPAAPLPAPLPVGGDLKPAQLIKSISPVYPALAKSQRVAGDVKIDALIDASGNVTSMKVLSGPVLLHQAAMDALKQWKYRAAELDGRPTAMHLAVIIQFHLQ